MNSAKVSKRPMTAGRAKKIAKNSLVHIILAILVVIWLFPIFWIIMTSLRGESGAYTAYFFPKELTFNNYKRLFTETTLLNFPRAFYEYADHFHFFMLDFNDIRTECILLYVKTAL